MGMRGY